MIIYDYKCHACGHKFDRRLPSEDRLLPEKEPCPECGEYSVKRDIGAPQLRDPASIGIKKPDGEFRDMLKKMKKDYHGTGQIDRYT